MFYPQCINRKCAKEKNIDIQRNTRVGLGYQFTSNLLSCHHMHYCMMHTHVYPLQEMRFLTKRLRDKDEEDVVVGDWKFAAMVIDRCSDSMLQFVLYDLWEYVSALISMIPLE